MRLLIVVAGWLCMLSLQGCFEILEQLSIREDGSGDLKLTLNMSRSRTRLNSIMKMATVNGHKVPSKAEIEKKADEFAAKITQTKGISGLKKTIDFTNFIATLECRFNAVANLNTALAALIPEKKDREKALSYQFEPSLAEFRRLNTWNLKGAYEKMSNADKEIFSTATYTSVFRFEKSIISASNASSQISPSRKAVMLKVNVLDVIKSIKKIDNTIRLEK